MKMRLIAAASAAAVATGLAGAASATPATTQALAFTDFTPDPATLAATEALYVTTGMRARSWCGGLVPAAPGDVNAHRLVVTRPSVLRLELAATGAWGVEVDRAGTALAGASTDRTPTSPAVLTVQLAPGTYSLTACNLGGTPDAQATYRLTPAR